MVLNRNPDNFFAETEQVAFHPGHLVPGIDFSNDPLLQGRLFSYTDTQLSRLGGPNFHELPINRGICPFHNFQRDGIHRQAIGVGQVAYEPKTLADGKEFRVEGAVTSPAGFASYPEVLEPPKLRVRSASFNDHFSQARMFWISQTGPEQDHIVAAFQFELSKLETPAIRQRMVDNLAHVDVRLASRVAAPLGIAAPDGKAAAARPGFRAAPVVYTPTPSAALSMARSVDGSIATRKVAILVADGVDGAAIDRVKQGLLAAGAQCKVLAAHLGTVHTADGALLAVDQTLVNAPSIAFDAVYLPSMTGDIAALASNGDAIHFVLEAYKHCKAIAASGAGTGLMVSLGIQAHKGGAVSEPQAGVVLSGPGALPPQFVEAFIRAIGQHRHWARSHIAAVPA